MTRKTATLAALAILTASCAFGAGEFAKLDDPQPADKAAQKKWKLCQDLGYEAWRYTAADGRTLLFRLKPPPNYDANKRYPLVVGLSGVGGRGSDNLHVGNCEAAKVLAREDIQKEHPAILFVPQCPADASWVEVPWSRPAYDLSATPPSKPMAVVLEALPLLMQRFSADPARVYVAGQSMGGWGTWDLIARKPEWFAAAVPVCGGGDPKQAARIKPIAVWAFHGAKDGTVPVRASRNMIEALRAAGAEPRYTEYPEGGHAVWINAWKTQELTNWLLEQKRPGTTSRPAGDGE